MLEAEVVETLQSQSLQPGSAGDGAQMSEAEDIKEEKREIDQPAAPTVPLRTSRKSFCCGASGRPQGFRGGATRESIGGRFRRAAGARPVTGLLMATLAVVLAAGV